eukprot:TRINITY_DN63140_c0_g1_i1.p1 TRINITY_DN63140_c0_g1~~TRINITY_DN63140_c0_g1_i1.p1  ORF type:complete len:156 (+),score=19.47 TRINITY_DN63140_c0_g1_i1:100-567(+)
MPVHVLRCKTWNPHRNWQDHCEKARGVQITKSFGAEEPLQQLPRVNFMDQQASLTEMLYPDMKPGTSSTDLAKTLPPRVAWFPKGSNHAMNNTSTMLGGVVRTNYWSTSGGMRTQYQTSVGRPRPIDTHWQEDLSALRTRSVSLPGLGHGLKATC